MIENLGFLSMRFEKNEKRDFRPEFFSNLADLPQKIKLDYGYGEKLGYTREDYLRLADNIEFCNRREVLQTDCLVAVRTPILEELEMMKEGATIFSMLHFSTRSSRNSFLKAKEIHMYAMDSVTDDFGQRMIQDFSGTAKNAIESCFNIIDRDSIPSQCRTLVLGSGELGKICADSAIRLSPIPSIAATVGKRITADQKEMEFLLRQTDILIDATKRVETSKYIIPNEWISYLPEHAVIVDISADDYDTSIQPIQVKGIEGIPTGCLDKYVFDVDDPIYELIPESVSTEHRRKVVSCNAWPGVNACYCLNKYEKQLLPFIYLLSNKNEFLESSADVFERALYRSRYCNNCWK